jgi:hypothetical protein
MEVTRLDLELVSKTSGTFTACWGFESLCLRSADHRGWVAKPVAALACYASRRA